MTTRREVFRAEPFPNLSRATNSNRAIVGPVEVPAYATAIGVVGVVIGGGLAVLGVGSVVAHGRAHGADIGAIAGCSLIALLGVWFLVMGISRWRWKSEFERVIGRPPQWGHEAETRIPEPGDPISSRFGGAPGDRWKSPDGIAKRSRSGAKFFTWCGVILAAIFVVLGFITVGFAAGPASAGSGFAISLAACLTASAAGCALLCFLRARRLRRWARDMDDVIANPHRRIGAAPRDDA